MSIHQLTGQTAVVTGGTDGIGAATARRLHLLGAHVVVIGRSQTKADRLLAEATDPGTLETLVADFSLMRTVRETVARLAAQKERIDLLVHAVGILLPRKVYTAEGVEKDFAVSYLARFAFLEEAARLGLLQPNTRMVNIAVSAPKVPWYARVEFSSPDLVRARTGMRGHGQAQLANELLTAASPARYGITAIGYGPGAVDTNIRRELPGPLLAAMRPLFARSTRRPDEAAQDVVDALVDPALPTASASFRNRDGAFPAPAYVADARRQADVVRVSQTLLADAVGVDLRG